MPLEEVPRVLREVTLTQKDCILGVCDGELFQFVSESQRFIWEIRETNEGECGLSSRHQEDFRHRARNSRESVTIPRGRESNPLA